MSITKPNRKNIHYENILFLTNSKSRDASFFIQNSLSFLDKCFALEELGKFSDAAEICMEAARKIDKFIEVNRDTLLSRQIANLRCHENIAIAHYKSMTEKHDYASSWMPVTNGIGMPAMVSQSHYEALNLPGTSSGYSSAAKSDAVSNEVLVPHNGVPSGAELHLMQNPTVKLLGPFTEKELHRSEDDEKLRKFVIQAITIELSEVKWESVIGCVKAKTEVKKAILLPIDYPDSPQAKNASTGILLFGVMIYSLN